MLFMKLIFFLNCYLLILLFVICPHRLSENNFCYCCYDVYLAGHTPRTISSSPSTESLSGGRDHAMSSPPLPVSRGRDSSTSSPPSSATKKDSFFNISRSRSHSKTINKKDAVSSEFSSCNSCFLFYNFTTCSLGLSFCGNSFFILHANYYFFAIWYYYVVLFVLYFIGAICMLIYAHVFLHTGGAGSPGVVLTGSD